MSQTISTEAVNVEYYNNYKRATNLAVMVEYDLMAVTTLAVMIEYLVEEGGVRADMNANMRDLRGGMNG